MKMEIRSSECLSKGFELFLTCGKTKSGRDSLNSALSLLCGRGGGRASILLVYQAQQGVFVSITSKSSFLSC